MRYQKVVFTRVTPDESRANRHFFEGRVKKAFVQFLAYRGDFDELLSEDEIREAKKGRLPQDLDIHLFPLSGTKDPKVNDFSNLCVLHRSTHQHINRKIFEPQLKGIQEGESREIYIPKFKQVDAGRIRTLRNGRIHKNWIAVKRPPFRPYGGR